ncbi:hypothetical protein B0H16DRAFT_1716908 [Mycena metata]|uniref:Uncharacterized protein n=1 Tax=Mycena metata TaxID=1033252 RepID=A0AAD7JLB6_9AGAR|nr:hypothetical protein B0H16DRAFT_1716908 [Mycena metata]
MAISLFPSSGVQAFIAATQFLGVTILTFFFSRRVLGEPGSGQTLATLTWPRICILLVFIDSYLFVFTSGILIFGVGLQMNKTACAAGIYICVLFYSSSKVLIYAFLTEKVYIVWDTGRPRFRSPVFLVCIATVFSYVAVIIIMIIGRVEQFRPGDHACVIGLKPTASIPLLSYDLFINILLTTLFLWPLLRSTHSSARLRRVATRTLVASAMALTTSTINIAVLTIMKGRQLGWLCLACCGVDVLCNAAALFWVTARPPSTGVSGNRLSEGRNNNSGNVSLTSPPTGSVRSALGMKIDMMKSTQSFKMGNLSPPSTEFQIHVTTEREITKSPPELPASSQA